MGVGAVGDLIAHAGLQRERPPVGKLGVELAIHAEQDVALLAPVIGRIARRIVCLLYTSDAADE